MNELAILNQVAAICRYVNGIRTSFAPIDIPMQLDDGDLPAAVSMLGNGSRSLDAATDGVNDDGERYRCINDEHQDITIRVFCAHATQGYDVGDMVEFSVPFVNALLLAFDRRPKLVNADGSNPNDFNWQDAMLRDSYIRAHSGVTVQPYGAKLYFTIDFTLGVAGRTIAFKVEGN